jgi:hypothetical protein
MLHWELPISERGRDHNFKDIAISKGDLIRIFNGVYGKGSTQRKRRKKKPCQSVFLRIWRCEEEKKKEIPIKKNNHNLHLQMGKQRRAKRTKLEISFDIRNLFSR